jgi:hypothetical protein
MRVRTATRRNPECPTRANPSCKQPELKQDVVPNNLDFRSSYHGRVIGIKDEHSKIEAICRFNECAEDTLV